jgi:hypothetical protein
VAITGGIAVRHGWFWLPSTLLLKTAPPWRPVLPPADRLMRSLNQLFASPHLAVLAAGLAAAFYLRPRSTVSMQRADWMIAVTAPAILLHLQFAAVGWQFRYEAYLVALSLFVLACGLADCAISIPRSDVRVLVSPAVLLTVLVLVGISYPLLRRVDSALTGFAPASHNIYEQQYQMAQFLRRYYNDAPVAANDIGAINFYTDIHCFDLAGLSTLPVARDLLQETYTSEAIEEYTRRQGVRIALLYDNWFSGVFYPAPPLSWIKVGRWTVPDNVVLGAPAVTFYAAQPAECAPLRANLATYAPLLPKGVIVAQYECK